MIGPNDPEAAGDDLAQVKDAHDALVLAYLNVHRLADRNILLRATVDAHVRRGLRLLRREYAQAAIASVDSSERKAWLKGEAEQFEQFEDTFDRRWVPRFVSGRMLSVLPGVEILLGIVGLSGLSGIGVLISGTCACQVLWFVPLGVTMAIMVLGFTAFDGKRELFVKEDVYGDEDGIYRALDVAKRREPSLWGLAFVVIAATWLVAAILETLALSQHLFSNPNHNVYWIFFGLSAATAAVIFIRTRKREPA